MHVSNVSNYIKKLKLNISLPLTKKNISEIKLIERTLFQKNG